jgi:hypothetical protein
MTTNSSKLGNVNTIAAYNDCPCHLDEIKKEDIDMIQSLVYNHSNAQPRNRALTKGGNQKNKDKTFTSILMLTTEETIFGNNAKNGQLARVIPIIQIPKSNPKGVRKFEKLVCSKNKNCKNYGQALEPLVLKIFEMIQDGSLEKRFNEIEQELRTYNVKNSNMINRLIENYTGIALAGEIFNEAIVNHPENRGRIKALNPLEIVKEFMQDYLEQEPDKSEGTRAIEIIIDWYNGNRLKFNEPPQIAYNVNGETEYRDQTNEFYGYDEGETIDIFKYKVKDVLAKAGFVPDTIFGLWNIEGYTDCKKGRNDKYKVFKKEHFEMIQKDLKLQKLVGKGTSTQTISIIKKMVSHFISESTSNNEDYVIDFFNEKMIFGNAIIESTLQEIHESYVEWCSERSIIPIKKLDLHVKIIDFKKCEYHQNDENDINTISYFSIGLKETNYSVPIKLSNL